MATTAELKTAFDAAIAQTRKSLKAGMKTIGGESAVAHLEKLQQELPRCTSCYFHLPAAASLP